MKITRDFFNRPMVPDYVLCKASRERIGVLRCSEKTMDITFNGLGEIRFTTHLYIDGEKNPCYEFVDVMKHILVPDIGFYSISTVDIESQGTKREHKNVTAKSVESLMAQKYLEEFSVNTGTVSSIDGVRFCDIREKDKSLLHLALEKCPGWKIGHVDASLMTMRRSFEISRQDVYSFLMDDVAKAFECFFLFDTLNSTVNIYESKKVGRNTNISVSYINLLKSVSLSCSTDHIKTCLTLTGDGGLTVREINMGCDKIINLGYYNSTEYMSKGLYESYNRWTELKNSKKALYTSLLSQSQECYKQINFLTHEKMPSTSGDTTWTEYGLNPLKEQLSAYEQRQSLSMKAGHGDPSSPFYATEYLPLYKTIQDINAQLKNIEIQIEFIKKEQSSITRQMSDIASAVSVENNFTESERNELESFMRQDELSSSNYIVTDTMTDDEKFKMLDDMLKFGEGELAKVSIPQLSFTADIANLFAIPEFEPLHDDFEVGNYIWVTLRDGLSIKARLLSIHVNFHDVTDFSVTFGNIARTSKSKYSDIAEAVKNAANAATSLSYNSSYWSQSAKDTSAIGKMLDEGLIAAGKYLKNGDDSELVIDARGIFVNTTSGEHAYKDSIFFGGGRILFTDDNWNTVRMSVGRADVTVNGKTESRFGTFADFVIAGYVTGSILEGDEIWGGSLRSSNHVPGRMGSLINLENGTFEFNSNNEHKLTLDADGSLTVKGVIKADSGYIGGGNGFSIMPGRLYNGKESLDSDASGVYIGTDGIALGANSKFRALPDGTFHAEKGCLGGLDGFTLGKSKMYNGKPSLSDRSNGIYLGTDGIALGNGTFIVTVRGELTAKAGMVGDFTINNAIYSGKAGLASAENGVYIGRNGIALGADHAFSVTQNGVLTAKSGTIGGAVLTGDSIRSSNNNWWIRADGSASFKNVVINGNSTFGSVIDNPFGGTAIPHIEELAVNQITADRIKTRALEAGFITAESIAASYATIGSLTAAEATLHELAATRATIEDLRALDAKVNRIDADYASVSSLHAVDAKVNSISADYVKTSQLDAVDAKFARLNANNITSGTLSADRIDVDGIFSFMSAIEFLTVGGTVHAGGFNGTHGSFTSLYATAFSLADNTVTVKAITIGGTTYRVLCCT